MDLAKEKQDLSCASLLNMSYLYRLQVMDLKHTAHFGRRNSLKHQAYGALKAAALVFASSPVL